MILKQYIVCGNSSNNQDFIFLNFFRYCLINYSTLLFLRRRSNPIR